MTQTHIQARDPFRSTAMHRLALAGAPRRTLFDEWRRTQPGERRRIHSSRLAAGTALVSAAVFITIVASLGLRAPSVQPAPQLAMASNAPAAAHEPAWIDVNRPFHMFDLTAGPFARLPLTYTAKRDENGTARQDTLTYGPPVPRASFFRIAFYRKGPEKVSAGSLFVDVVRTGAEAGLSVLHSSLPAAIETRFGLFEVADMTLVGSGSRASCLGFRRVAVDATDPLAITGMACDPDDAVDRKALACTLDKLDLVSAGDDEALQLFFADAEQRRGLGCTSASTAAADPSTGSFPLRLKRSLTAEANYSAGGT